MTDSTAERFADYTPLTDFIATAILQFVPLRHLYWLFGPYRILWQDGQPWKPVAFTMGVIAASQTDDPRIASPRHEVTERGLDEWLMPILSDRPRSYVETFPEEGSPGLLEGLQAYGEWQSELASRADVGIHCWRRTAEGAFSVTQHWINGPDPLLRQLRHRVPAKWGDRPSMRYLEQWVTDLIDIWLER